MIKIRIVEKFIRKDFKGLNHDKKHRFVRDSKVGFFSETAALVEKITSCGKGPGEGYKFKELRMELFKHYTINNIRSFNLPWGKMANGTLNIMDRLTN